MTKSVILPNGDFAEFPDDLTDEQANFAAEQQWAARQQDPEQVAGVREKILKRMHPMPLALDEIVYPFRTFFNRGRKRLGRPLIPEKSEKDASPLFPVLPPAAPKEPSALPRVLRDDEEIA